MAGGEAGRATVSKAGGARSQNARIVWIDVAKGLGIVLMTFGHVAEAPGGDGWVLPALASATTWVYLFHMPAFFLLGGLTYRAGQPLRTFAVKKARSLLVPYAIYSLYFPVKAIALAVVSGDASFGSVVEAVVASIIDVYWYGRGLWFLAAYFVGELMAYGIIDIARAEGFQLALVGIALYVASFVWAAHAYAPGGVIPPFELVNGIRAAGLMCVGAAARRRLPANASFHRLPYVCALTAAVVSFALSGWCCVNGAAPELGWLPSAVAALAGSAMLALVALLVPHIPWLEGIGRASLLYYVVAPEATNVVRLPAFALLAITGGAPGVVAQWLITLVVTLAILALSRPLAAFIQGRLPWTVGLSAAARPAWPSTQSNIQ